jgi:MYXO-CTERM domain-containing protein
MNRNLFVFACGLATLASSAAWAQVGTGGTITSRNVSFSITDYLGDGTGAGANSDLTVGGIGNPDHLNSAWWWFRLQNDTRETAFSGATSATYAGDTARVTYNYGSFEATMIWKVTGFRDGRGLLTETLSIHNTSNAALSINLFNYNDLAVGGTDGNDVATQIASNAIRIDDSANTGWKVAFEGTDSFDVTGGSVNVLGLLTDNSVDGLANRGLPIGGGSFKGAYQWTLNLAANEAATASSTLTITPTPGSLALMGLGGLVMGRRRR